MVQKKSIRKNVSGVGFDCYALRKMSNLLFAALMLTTFATGALQAQDTTNYCYLAYPSDVIGFKYNHYCIQITYDGSFNTGIGEFALFLGTGVKQANVREKYYTDGKPILTYSQTVDTVQYAVQSFGATMDMNPLSELVGFVKVTATNNDTKAHQARICGAFLPRRTSAQEIIGMDGDDWINNNTTYKNGQVTVGSGTATRGGYLVFQYAPADSLAQMRLPSDTTTLDPSIYGIAVGKPVTATSNEAGSPPSAITDGSTTGSYWGASPAPQSVTIDLQALARIDSIRVFPYFDGTRYYQYTAAISTDNSNWTTVGDFSANTQPATAQGTLSVVSPSSNARYIKVTMTHNSANPAVHLYEVRVFGAFIGGTISPPNVPAAATAAFTLPAKGSRTVYFWVPRHPLAPSDATVQAIGSSTFADFLTKIDNLWSSLFAAGAQFTIPEKKVSDAMKASLAYDFMALNAPGNAGGSYEQHVNHLQYDGFWDRDASYIINVYDRMGYPQDAKNAFAPFIQSNDFRIGGPDAWGQPLWALGEHYQMTRDTAWLRPIYNQCMAGRINDLVNSLDNWGIWPVAGPYDNEILNNQHYVGHSFFILHGLVESVIMAKALGKTADAQSFQQIHDTYFSNFMPHLSAITSQTGGYIPPGLEDPSAGCDWENMTAGLWPHQVFQATDPIVNTTFDFVRNHSFLEGVMTYGLSGINAWKVRNTAAVDFIGETALHLYITTFSTQGNIIRGAQRKVLEDLYSLLVHTGTTHGAFEYGSNAWSTSPRVGGNVPPHGWGAALYNFLVRDMFVREANDTLHLASVLSPVWVLPGKQVGVSNAPTHFGPVTFLMTCNAAGSGAQVALSNSFFAAPGTIAFHIPWFLNVSSATADGVPVPVQNGIVYLTSSAKNCTLNWTWNINPDLSYATGVNLYLNKIATLKAGQKLSDRGYRFLFDDTTATLPLPGPLGMAGQASRRQAQIFKITVNRKFIEVTAAEKTTLTIALYDMAGRRVCRLEGQDGRARVSLAQLKSAGVYIVRVRAGDRSGFFKVMAGNP
jgi:hypothetical protein